MLTRMLDPSPGDSLVDIAAGTGHTALHLRGLVSRAVLVDLTPAMLEEAKELARKRGLAIETLVADAARVPLPDGSCSIATCRRAAHHFPDNPGFLREAARLLRPGGRLGIVDMTAPDTAIDLLNRVERLRDASHAAAIAPEGWRAAVQAAGFQVEAVELEQEEYALLRWLAPVRPEEVDLAAIAAALRAATPVEAAALQIHDGPEGIRFVKSRVVLTARKG